MSTSNPQPSTTIPPSPQPSTTSDSTTSSNNNSTRPYTQAQLDKIQEILNHKSKNDLYGVLGLEKGSSEADVKKGYRKMALQYHPDKCGAPGTEDAFRAINHAWAILGDPSKKERYDKFGTDSEAARGSGPGYTFASASFGTLLTPYELYKMFFDGDATDLETHLTSSPQFLFFPPTPQPTPSNDPLSKSKKDDNKTSKTIQPPQPTSQSRYYLYLIPVIMLLWFSLTYSFGGARKNQIAEFGNVFSWKRGGGFDVERRTQGKGVVYFVGGKTVERDFNGVKR
ncbi:DnaJ, sub C member 18, partial [Blyttiomyces sp. JEL0837]